jgi:hypothetical protein
VAEIIDFAAKKEAKRLAALNKAVVMAVLDDIVFIESLPSIDWITPPASHGYKIEISEPATGASHYRPMGLLDKPCDTE